ncbi:putative DNA methylase [Polaromonas sp. CG9_12]|nr:putative DNA methylase [Polaromonas sp. CG9_12]
MKPGATNAANDATGATHRMADSSDHTAGAGSEIVAQNQPEGNPDIRYSRSAMKSIDANVRRGREALARALDEKTTVHRAMFRNGLGWVDFVWGSEGVTKASGKTKGAMGLSHILEARQRKDGMREAEVTHLLGRIVRTIAQGTEVRRAQAGNIERVVLAHQGVEAVLTRRAGSNAWLLSGWKIWSLGEGGAGNVATTTTASKPTTAQPVGVSRDGEIVAQNDSGGNPDIRYSRRAASGYTQAATAKLNEYLSHPGNLSLWDRTVGSQYAWPSAARRSSGCLTSRRTSSMTCPFAPTRRRASMPRMDSLADLKKGPTSSTNDMAIAVPILKGTLSWGSDEDGVSVCIEVLQTRSWVSKGVWPRNDRGRWGTDQALRCMTAPG